MDFPQFGNRPVTVIKGQVKYKLPCGHIVHGGEISEMDPNESLKNHVCKEICNRRHDQCGHPCQKPCHGKKECGPCPDYCEYVHPLCGHRCMKTCGVECGTCTWPLILPIFSCPRNHWKYLLCADRDLIDFNDMRCDELIYPAMPDHPKNLRLQSCGHKNVQVPCYEADDMSVFEINFRCREVPCQERLTLDPSCNHECSGSCGECFRGRIHKRCMEPCGKVMICNHVCKSPCGAGCPPCKECCFRACDHKACDKLCGAPCYWMCTESCVYGCVHGQCTRACDQVCDKQPCMEPCPKKLICGHSCMGFCGEPCPPYCFYCDKEPLEKGALITLGDVDETDKYIYLEGCGHAIEHSSMNQWMTQEPVDMQILPLVCPICRTRLRWLHRYSEIMTKNWDLVESVKERMFGSDEAIQTQVEDVKGILERFRQKIAPERKRAFYPEFLKKVEKILEVDRRSELTLEMANFLEWVLLQWRHAAKQLKCEYLLYQYDEDTNKMEDRWRELVELLGLREWPLQGVELMEYYRERKRLDDYTELYSLIHTCRERDEESFITLYFGDLGQKYFMKAQTPLKLERSFQYDKETEKKFRKEFNKFKGHMKVTVGITPEEKEQVVRAFGTRTGRWFKCPNGHVYVVTECGGVMTVGMCPECKVRIGGMGHQPMEGNYLAQEMDGAEEPAYAQFVREQQAIRAQLARQQQQNN